MAADLRDEYEIAFAEGFENLAQAGAAKMSPEALAETWDAIGAWVDVATERLFPPSSTSRRRMFRTLMVALFWWGRTVERAAIEREGSPPVAAPVEPTE
ncbi:MAG: hypothetical protein QOI20_3231 [Acidimicrobiaceae bacterium]|nr:hypothetical protein [Acidimicrobiaceae bacterium]